MNKERIAIGYRALEPATDESFNITSWGSDRKSNKCGMIACAGGWLAHSEEFTKLGGRISYYKPVFGNREADASIDLFYECKTIDESEVISIMHYLSDNSEDTMIFYDVNGENDSIDESGHYISLGVRITPKMVQEKFAILYFILCICE